MQPSDAEPRIKQSVARASVPRGPVARRSGKGWQTNPGHAATTPFSSCRGRDPRWRPVPLRTRRPNGPREGAAVVETAVALTLFVTLLLGTVDLGYGIFRYHVLAQSARKIARHATVRGSLADRLGSWGPDRVAASAEEDEEVAHYIAPSLVGWDLPAVNIQIDWIDGGNEAEKGHRVRVHLSAPFQPMMTFILGSPVITLTSTSVMRIAH